MHCLWHPMTSSSQRWWNHQSFHLNPFDGWPAWELVCPVDRFLQGCETEFDRLCLGFTYLEQWTFAQYSQKKGKQCAEMHLHGDDLAWPPRSDTLSEFQLPSEKRTWCLHGLCRWGVGWWNPSWSVDKVWKWFASRFDGRDLHCPSCSEFQAIHCWT